MVVIARSLVFNAETVINDMSIHVASQTCAAANYEPRAKIFVNLIKIIFFLPTSVSKI